MGITIDNPKKEDNKPTKISVKHVFTSFSTSFLLLYQKKEIFFHRISL